VDPALFGFEVRSNRRFVGGALPSDVRPAGPRRNAFVVAHVLREGWTPEMTERIARLLRNRPRGRTQLTRSSDRDVTRRGLTDVLALVPFRWARIDYAVKANSGAQIVARLDRKGGQYSICSERGENRTLSASGIAAEGLSVGNTILQKKPGQSPLPTRRAAAVRLRQRFEIDTMESAAPGARWSVDSCRMRGCRSGRCRSSSAVRREMDCQALRRARANRGAHDTNGVPSCRSQQTDLAQGDGDAGRSGGGDVSAARAAC